MKSAFIRMNAIGAAILIAVLTIVTVERAYATTTVANASRTLLTVAPSTFSTAVTLKSLSAPVFVMASSRTETTYGVASLTVYHADTIDATVVTWNGFDYSGGIAHGNLENTGSGVPYTDMAAIGSHITIQTNIGNMRVMNTGSETATCSIEQIW